MPHPARPRRKPQQNTRRPRRLCAAIALALGTTLPALPAAAVELTWNGLFGSPLWSAQFLGLSNWNDGLLPQNGDSLVFAGNAGLINTNDYSGLSVARLSFAAGAGAFRIDGLVSSVETRIGVTHGISNQSSQMQTINLGIEARGSGMVWDGGSHGLTVTGSLFLAGDSSLSLINAVSLQQLSNLSVGTTGSARLNVLSGGVVSSRGGVVGEGPGKTGAVNVSGAGSQWTTGAGSLMVGGAGNGSLLVDNSGRVNSGGGRIGDLGEGSVTVTGNQSEWAIAGDLRVGGGGSGTLTVLDGGLVSSHNANIGPSGGRVQGSVLVSGANARWVNNGHMLVGAGADNGLFQVNNGGFVSTGTATLGGESSGRAIVSGPGSRWAVARELVVGNRYGGSLEIAGGGGVTSTDAVIGQNPTLPLSGGSVVVKDAGSTWVNSGRLDIGLTVNGTSGNGALNIQSGATVAVGGALRIGDGGVLNLQGGTLQINDAAVLGAGQFNWTAGTLRFTNAGATLGAGLFQLGSTTSLAASQVLEFAHSFAVGAGHQMLLAGGTLGGTGTLLNDGYLAGFGALAGSGGFTNSGVLVQTGGNLVLSNTGTNRNTGNWDLAPGQQLQLAGATLANHGTLNLNGGSVGGSGTLVNAVGGTVTGRGSVSALFNNAGALALESGTTTLGQAFNNSGQIQLASNTATLAGGLISNSGSLEGRGRVNNAIHNTGSVEALGGTLTLAGAVNNTGNGVLAAGTGTKLVVLQGLAHNSAHIQLAGGSFDNNGAALTNDGSGTISGQGTLRSGALVNDGRILLASGPTAVHADLRATSGSQIILSGQSNTAFYGPVEVQSGAELRVSQGSVATFFGMVNQRSGALLTGSGDKYYEGGLAIGNSPGLGVDAGSVTFGASNIYTAEVAGTAAGDALGIGIQFDRYVVAGTLTFGGTLKLVTLDSFAPLAGQSFDLFDWGSSQGSFAALDFAAAPLAAGLAWDASRLYVDGSLQVAAVPEPATTALWLAGLVAVGAAARRRPPGA